MNKPIRVAVLTLSDRCSRGEAVDLSGPALVALAKDRLAATIVHTQLLSDDLEPIVHWLKHWSDPVQQIDLIVTTGGTGLSPRDNTPEAAARLIDRPHPALMDLARLRCLPKTPRTFLSRGISGVARQTLILTLPGSPKGAVEMLEALLDILPHAIDTLRGDA